MKQGTKITEDNQFFFASRSRSWLSGSSTRAGAFSESKSSLISMSISHHHTNPSTRQYLADRTLHHLLHRLAFGLVEIFIRKLICCTAPTCEANPKQVRIRIKDISDLHTDPDKSSTRFLCCAGFLRAIKEFLAISKLRQQATQTRWLSNQRMQTKTAAAPACACAVEYSHVGITACIRDSRRA
jgi:hypothetical protein